jgi:hypothetical protein
MVYLLRSVAVLVLLGLAAAASWAGFIVYDGNEAGYRAGLTTYGLTTSVIGFDALDKGDYVTDQYLDRGVLFIPGNGGINGLKVDDDMNDVPPISLPWAIQINDDNTLQTYFDVEFYVPIRTLALWHGDVAASGGNVLYVELWQDGTPVATFNLTNSKDTARFAGIVVTEGDWFNGARLLSKKVGDAWGLDNFEYEYIMPEPGLMTLLGLAGMGIVIARRRR